MPVGPVRRDDDTATFFDGTARGQFLLRRCPDGHHSGPAAQLCAACASTELQWVPAAGGARVVSWSVTHGRPTPDSPGARTVLAVTELDEGPWWWSQIIDADPDTITEGQRLRVAFQRFDDRHEAVPVFQLA